MAELESVLEERLIAELTGGESQWTYRPDIRTEEALWAILSIFWSKITRLHWETNP